MKTTDLLFELGNTYSDYQLVASEPDYAEIRADDLGLTVYLNEIRGVTDIEFSVNGKYRITGTGDAYRILATVKRVLEEFLPDFSKKSTSVSFVANEGEPSRVKLYKRAAPLISSILGPDWVYGQGEADNNRIFTWRKMTTEAAQLDLFPSKIYHVMVNGKIWKKEGKPVEFSNYQEADRAVLSIIDRYGKPAQVIDPARYPVKNQ